MRVSWKIFCFIIRSTTYTIIKYFIFICQEPDRKRLSNKNRLTVTYTKNFFLRFICQRNEISANYSPRGYAGIRTYRDLQGLPGLLVKLSGIVRKKEKADALKLLSASAPFQVKLCSSVQCSHRLFQAFDRIVHVLFRDDQRRNDAEDVGACIDQYHVLF